MAAIESVGLRRPWAWRLAALIAKALARHDSRAEAHDGARRGSIYRELGVVERESLEGAAHLCGTPYEQLYRLHSLLAGAFSFLAPAYGLASSLESSLRFSLLGLAIPGAFNPN